MRVGHINSDITKALFSLGIFVFFSTTAISQTPGTLVLQSAVPHASKQDLT